MPEIDISNPTKDSRQTTPKESQKAEEKKETGETIVQEYTDKPLSTEKDIE